MAENLSDKLDVVNDALEVLQSFYKISDFSDSHIKKKTTTREYYTSVKY